MFEMVGQAGENRPGVLVGNQATGDLGMCLRRQYRFDPFVSEPAPDSVDFQGRACPGAFECRVAGFAEEFLDSEVLGVAKIIAGDRG